MLTTICFQIIMLSYFERVCHGHNHNNAIETINTKWINLPLPIMSDYIVTFVLKIEFLI